MPIIGVVNKDSIEMPPLGELVVQGDATGLVCPVKVGALGQSRRHVSSTGVFLSYSHQDAAVAFALGFGTPIMGIEKQIVGIPASEVLEQQTTADLSPLVLGQIEEIVPGINSKLRERLSRYWSDHPGQDLVSPYTMTSVNRLVAWLNNQSGTVSATVSSDGMLSIATVFPDDVRLYVEIERDGSVGAAVTRERRFASDISADSVADLTPEVILAAVASI